MNTPVPMIIIGDQFAVTASPPHPVWLLTIAIGLVGTFTGVVAIVSSLRDMSCPALREPDRMSPVVIIVLALVLGAVFATGVTGLRHWTYTTCPDDLDEVASCGAVVGDDRYVAWTESGRQVTYTVANGPGSSFWHPEHVGTVTRIDEPLLVRDVTDDDPVNDVSLLRDVETLTGSGSVIVARDRTLNDQLFTIQHRDAHLVVDAPDGSRRTLHAVRFKNHIAYYEEETS